jgi:hypothetical protein
LVIGSSRQTHKSTKDYYSLKKESGRKKGDFENVDRTKDIIAVPVYASATAVEARAPLSYSDILKSRPNIQVGLYVSCGILLCSTRNCLLLDFPA